MAEERITESGDLRITEEGDQSITEDGERLCGYASANPRKAAGFFAP